MFARSSIRARLLALLMVPAVILVVLAGLQLTEALEVVGRTADLDRLTRVAEAERSLLHSLQVERTRSLETLAAEADGQAPGAISDELRDARAAVAAAQAQVDGTLTSLQLQEAAPRVYRAHQNAQARLRALDALRLNLEGGRADAATVISAFGRPVQELLDVDLAIINALGESQVSGRLQASYAVSHLKDAAFRSTDLLLLSAAGGLDEQTAIRLLSQAQTEQQTWLDVALTQLTAEEQAALQAAVGEIPDADELIAVLTAGGSSAGVTAMADSTTASADGLRQLENQFVTSLVVAAEEERSSATITAAILAALSVVVLALLALLLLVMVRNVLGPLRELTRLATGVREALPEAVDRLARGEEATEDAFTAGAGAELLARGDELGELARAIRSSTDEATRVAVGHAATKAGITRTIEDVARREQALVERQLSLLDRLEDVEDDPDQLAQLFKLDHLATRMRRNAENLLLLSAARLPGSHDSAPVPLVDVARTAAAEIEQYGRVDVRVGVFDTVLGYAATPISHLLAELIENATQFSPPTSRVTVAARLIDDGVLISVIDHGLGMSSTDIADARRKLAEPPLLEAAESRRLGLYVVGLIASKLGIAVDMRASEGDKGITVDVVIPQHLFVGGAAAAPSAPQAVLAGQPDPGPAAPAPRSEPAQAQPAQTQPVPAQPRPVQAQPVAQPQPVHPQPVAQAQPVQAQPVQAQPVQAQPVHAQPQPAEQPVHPAQPPTRTPVPARADLRVVMPDLETPPDALSAMGQLLDAELAAPPDLPADVQPLHAGNLPQRSSSERAPVDDLSSGRTISMSKASGGRVVDINPDAISALMGGLSDLVGPAAEPVQIIDAPTIEPAPQPAQPRARRQSPRPGGGGGVASSSSWSTPFPPQGGPA